MKQHFLSHQALVLTFWFLALITIPIWGYLQEMPPGWDLRVYVNAIHSLQAHHDPYVDGIAVQRAFHLTPQALDPNIMPPYTYVYSPITLPLLAKIGAIPPQFSAPTYWLVYILFIAIAALVGAQLAEDREGNHEKKLFALLAPAAMFFPGLLQNGVIFSGNIAYLFYGLALATALVGWRRNTWKWFYLAVLAASCFKAPLLTLIAIPILSARKQWLPAILTGAAGTALFAIQPLLWPTAFHNYLEAIKLQFSYNHDFGISPAGIIGTLLFERHLSYSPATTILYLAYAIPLFAALLYLSRRYFAGRITIEQWAPILLIGVILLNPRIKEYDVAPLTLPMALIAWRILTRTFTLKQATIITAISFLAINAVAILWSRDAWKPEECLILVTLFTVGCWNLVTSPATAPAHAPEPTHYHLSLVS